MLLLTWFHIGRGLLYFQHFKLLPKPQYLNNLLEMIVCYCAYAIVIYPILFLPNDQTILPIGCISELYDRWRLERATLWKTGQTCQALLSLANDILYIVIHIIQI